MAEVSIKSSLQNVDPDLVKEIEGTAVIQNIPKGTEILREGQYVKVIPLVLEGLVKVYTRHEDRELLLYYIQPRESCIMSFSAGIENEPSKVIAVTEEDSQIALMPVDKVEHWRKNFPDMNSLFFKQFNLRYAEVLDTINHLIFNRMDERIEDFLRKRQALSQSEVLKISHRHFRLGNRGKTEIDRPRLAAWRGLVFSDPKESIAYGQQPAGT